MAFIEGQRAIFVAQKKEVIRGVKLGTWEWGEEWLAQSRASLYIWQ